MAASVDHTSGSIFLTPLTELATPNSHTVTQNCTASWTTGNKVHGKSENVKILTRFHLVRHDLRQSRTRAHTHNLMWISSTTWSWWQKWLSPLAGQRSLYLWDTAPASPASWAPRLLPPSLLLSVGLAASSDWPRRYPHQNLRWWEDNLAKVGFKVESLGATIACKSLIYYQTLGPAAQGTDTKLFSSKKNFR